MMRVLFVTAILAGCGGSVSPSQQTDSGTTARVPLDHRATPAACPTTRPAGTSGPMGGTCTTDAECTAGKNGRCIGSLPAVPACSYDECFTDSDCGGRVCACRSDADPNGPNRCINTGCRTDADCPGSYCSSSGLFLNPYCFAEGAQVGWFCHAPSDACIDDADCGGGDRLCAFDADKRQFRCMTKSCAL